MDIDMKIKDIKLDQIKPYENNPRKNEDAISKVAESIKTFGFNQPLVVDKNMVIIVGHTRFEAAKLLKLETVPTLISDMDPKQAKEYRLVDNKTQEFSDWDYQKLLSEMDGLNDDLKYWFGQEDIADFQGQYIDPNEFSNLDEQAIEGDVNTWEPNVEQQKVLDMANLLVKSKNEQEYNENLQALKDEL